MQPSISVCQCVSALILQLNGLVCYLVCSNVMRKCLIFNIAEPSYSGFRELCLNNASMAAAGPS